MREHAFARDGSRSTTCAPDAAGNVIRRCIAAVGESPARRLSRSWREGCSLKACEIPGDDVAGQVVAGPSPTIGEPGFVVPRNDFPGGVDSGALFNYIREAVVLPRHLVFARELDPHGPPDCLRKDRGV